MKLYALAVYLPRDDFTIEQVLDAAISYGLANEVVAVTTSIKRIYLHLKTVESKHKLLRNGFFDPVASKPLVVTAQGIPIELSAKDVTSIFSSWGEVTKATPTTKQYKNIRYRNGNWQLHIKKFHKQLPTHISAKHPDITENIYITTAFDHAEMLKRVVPPRSDKSNPNPPPQPQRSGEEKLSNLPKRTIQKPTDQLEQGSSTPTQTGAGSKELYMARTPSCGPMAAEVDQRTTEDMEYEVNPTQVNRKRTEQHQELPKSPKKSKTTTNSTPGSVAQSAARQTSNPEVPVQHPSSDQNKTSSTSSKSKGESNQRQKVSKFATLTNPKPNSMRNKFSVYVSKRYNLFKERNYSNIRVWKPALDESNRYGDIAWAFFLTDIEWGALMFRLHELRNEKSGDKDRHDLHYDDFVDYYMKFLDKGPSKFSDYLGHQQVNYLLQIAQTRYENFKTLRTGFEPNGFYPSDNIWAIWRVNTDLFYNSCS